MRLARAVFLAICIGVTNPVAAADLVLPKGAHMTVERTTELDGFVAPVGAYADGSVPGKPVEGRVSRKAWRLDEVGMTPLQLVVPLRDQLETLGFDIVFECESTVCGGFDFRFAIEVLPGPNMFVNISSFHYLTAVKGPGEDPSEVLTVLASTTSGSGYLQIINTIPNQSTAGHANTQTDSVTAEGAVRAPETGIVSEQAALLEQGFVILHDLDFASGTSNLGPGPFASLAGLADVMSDRAGLRVALVGHTDTVGALDANIALSRARARAVRVRLIDEYGIDAGRLDAEGMGYLSPVQSNLTPEGRRQNRRVEAILLNVE